MAVVYKTQSQCHSVTVLEALASLPRHHPWEGLHALGGAEVLWVTPRKLRAQIRGGPSHVSAALYSL